MLNTNLFGEAVDEKQGSRLAERWDYPPFSVLNAREGWWQERKRQWVALGIQSEVGRGGELAYTLGELDRGAGRGNMRSEMANPDPSIYSKKARLEIELGREISYGEARVILAERGELRDKREASKQYFAVPGGGTSGTSGPGSNNVYKLKTKDGYVAAKDLAKAGLTWNAAGLDQYRVQEGTREDTQVSGTSIFDPVLAELAYRWWAPKGGTVLDPFAGGSVRGIIASLLGRAYHGIDLRQEQIDANYAQLDIAGDPQPIWHCGDSSNLSEIAAGLEADFIFSCPPYGYLEVYSDDPRDLSSRGYGGFLEGYHQIIASACALLKKDRFACFVVGNFRDKNGNYHDLVGDTVAGFKKAGLELYNEAVLVTAVGSLPMRTNAAFKAGRKLGKTHQNVLCFVKGNGKLAAAYCNACEGIEVSEVEAKLEAYGETETYLPAPVVEEPAVVEDEPPPISESVIGVGKQAKVEQLSLL